ncbi:MAG: hypothetical protein Ta2A_09520 [Treponemataceae bacterium]|nr:MAG: hypothetical protein Ta2A_09520 [Treponemataceae bacterium]
MKRIIFFIVLSSIAVFGFSQTNDYANGNGTIIDTKTFGNVQWTIRKHIQNVKIGNLAKKDNLIIYDMPSLNFTGKIIGNLKLNDNITVKQVAETEVHDTYFSWLLITVKNIEGWIFFGKSDSKRASYFAPYYRNRWEIVNTIEINNKVWRSRKILDQILAVWEVLNIRDKPGVVNTNIISKIIPSESNPQVNVIVIEATEERERIDNIDDRWLKIRHNNIEGWIFGGYASAERGGPKYYTPEALIDFGLNWY